MYAMLVNYLQVLPRIRNRPTIVNQLRKLLIIMF